MLATIEQFSASSKANSRNRLDTFNILTQNVFDSVTKLAELNLNVVKASLAESTVLTQQFLSVKDPQELFSLTAAHLAQQTPEKAISYGRQLASIASAMHDEFSKTTQAALAESHRNVVAAVEEAFKKVPTGSEPAALLVKSAFDNAAAGIELFTKGTQQAVGVLENHLANTANQASQAVKTTPRNAARA